MKQLLRRLLSLKRLEAVAIQAEDQMTRRELVIAALSPAEGAHYTPVQVQKLFFLLDRNIPEQIEGPHFDFRPHSYGPFDHEVYRELEALADEGSLSIASKGSPWRSYILTPSGREQGLRVIEKLSEGARDYIKTANNFVRSLSFTELVSAIYKEYPETRTNSVFKDQS